jgi:hypothetical protein
MVSKKNKEGVSLMDTIGEVPSDEMDLLVQIECSRRLNAKIGAHPWRYALNQ